MLWRYCDMLQIKHIYLDNVKVLSDTYVAKGASLISYQIIVLDRFKRNAYVMKNIK